VGNSASIICLPRGGVQKGAGHSDCPRSLIAAERSASSDETGNQNQGAAPENRLFQSPVLGYTERKGEKFSQSPGKYFIIKIYM